MLTRPCVKCGRPGTKTGMCTDCTRARYAQRPSTTARQYGAPHQARAARLRKLQRPCCLCHQPIDYALHSPDPMSFSAHHLTEDKAGPIDAAHRVCNERAGKPV